MRPQRRRPRLPWPRPPSAWTGYDTLSYDSPVATTEVTEQPARSGRAAVIGVIILGVAVVAYFALGMPGMDHSGSGGTMAGMDRAATGEPMSLSPDAFADRLTADVFVVNVHLPADAAIAGTDATIGYDRMVGDDRLPTDKDTPLLLYCRTGRMSAAAGRELIAVGYTDVSHLEGGMDAWARAGYDLEEA